ELHRYKVIDTGTLGGPTSSVGFEGERDINNRGVLVSTAETSSLDPFPPPNCFLGGPKRGRRFKLGHERKVAINDDLRFAPRGRCRPTQKTTFMTICRWLRNSNARLLGFQLRSGSATRKRSSSVLFHSRITSPRASMCTRRTTSRFRSKYIEIQYF